MQDEGFEDTPIVTIKLESLDERDTTYFIGDGTPTQLQEQQPISSQVVYPEVTDDNIIILESASSSGTKALRPERPCYYCSKMIKNSKLTRHISTVHKRIKEVKEMLNNPMNIRRVFFDRLKTMSILEYNRRLLTAGNSDDIIVERKHSNRVKLCNVCCKFISSRYFYNHRKRCISSAKPISVKSLVSFYSNSENQTSYLKENYRKLTDHRSYTDHQAPHTNKISNLVNEEISNDMIMQNDDDVTIKLESLDEQDKTFFIGGATPSAQQQIDDDTSAILESASSSHLISYQDLQIQNSEMNCSTRGILQRRGLKILRPDRPCYYCKKMIKNTKLTRHISTVHKNIQEVSVVLEKPPLARRIFFDNLKQLSILDHNNTMISAGYHSNILHVGREYRSPSKICTGCDKFIATQHYYAHKKTCIANHMRVMSLMNSLPNSITAKATTSTATTTATTTTTAAATAEASQQAESDLLYQEYFESDTLPALKNAANEMLNKHKRAEIPTKNSIIDVTAVLKGVNKQGRTGYENMKRPLIKANNGILPNVKQAMRPELLGTSISIVKVKRTEEQGNRTGISISSVGAIPSRAYTSIPSREYTSIPSGSITSIPSRAYTSIPSRAYTSIPSGSITSIPTGSTISVPTGSTTSIPSGSITSLPSGSITSLPSGSISSIPSGSITSVSSEEDPSTGTLSTPIKGKWSPRPDRLCYYCNRSIKNTKLTRHISKVHRHIPEVEEIINKPLHIRRIFFMKLKNMSMLQTNQ